jgi:glyoxylase-like metal-dependent hydrolase (beta-lactamase superfamily II)
MIPFVRDFAFAYGVAQALSPTIRRVIARNPGPFTFTGTGTFIVGRGRVAVVDPGPDDPEHFQALLRALDGETVSHVLVTHHHMDHSPLARALADQFGAELCGRPAVMTAEDGGAVRLEAGDDPFFRPDVEIGDGWQARGPGWTLTALHTPGHTVNHFCYAVAEENALLCGDHVMAWSTSIVSPPEGHMGRYLESLERILGLDFAVLYPAHGPHLEGPRAFIKAYIAHRRAREAQILACLAVGPRTIRALVEDLYREVERRLHPAAMHMILAHLIDLTERGVTVATPAPTLQAEYSLA